MDDPEGASESKTRRKAPPAANQQQTADYIAGVAFELGEMAADAELPFLRYLVEMVTHEALLEGEKYRRRSTDKQ